MEKAPNGVEFVNTYGGGTDGTAELNLKGNKEIVAAEGLTKAPKLEDNTFTFAITGNAAADGTPAPMPETTTATNNNGAVNFGPIKFTMENVFGAIPETQDAEVEGETENVSGTDAGTDAGIDLQTLSALRPSPTR